MKAIVVGAGIGGLTAALALQNAGIEVKIFESARELRPLGVGINVLPNAVRVLDGLGFGKELLKAGIETCDVEYLNRFGQLILREPRGSAAGYSFPQISAHRGIVQMALARTVTSRLGAENVVLGHHFDHFRVLECGRVEAVFIDRRTTAANWSETCDILVGADGIHSNVRRQLYPQEGAPRWSGVLTWRGAAEMPDEEFKAPGMIVAGHPDNQIFIAYRMNRPDPSSGRSLINWAAAMPAPDGRTAPPPEDWNRAIDPHSVIDHFKSWHFNSVDVPRLIEATPSVFEFPRVDRDPLPRWTFGRVTLLGDAAHPMHPWGSSGASLAIVDAQLLAENLGREPDLDVALAKYEDQQRPLTTKAVLANRAAGPVDFMKVVDARAPNGFDEIDKVISRKELDELAGRYKKLAGLELQNVNRPAEIQQRDRAWT